MENGRTRPSMTMLHIIELRIQGQPELQHLVVCRQNNNNDDDDDDNNNKKIKHEKYNATFHLVICQ